VGKNILISGGNGSGKTTTLNVLKSIVPMDEKVISINEDIPEMYIRKKNERNK
jgi:Flp pilus assembly CpaF family ATPase